MIELDSGPSQVEQLIATNSAAADVIAGPYEGLDASGADLIMANLVVATGRLSAADFADLSYGVQNQVLAVAFMADDIAPPNLEDLAQRGHEDEHDVAYRTDVLERINSLQRRLHMASHLPKSDQLETSKLKFVVKGAGSAFAALIHETQQLPAIAETIDYFIGNTNSAARRAARIAARAEEEQSSAEER